MRAVEGAQAQVDDADVGIERRGGREPRLRQLPRTTYDAKGGPSQKCLANLIGYRWRASTMVVY